MSVSQNRAFQVLCEVILQMKGPDVIQGTSQALEAVTAVVKSWTDAKEGMDDVWNSVLSTVKSLPQQQALEITKAVLKGMSHVTTLFDSRVAA